MSTKEKAPSAATLEAAGVGKNKETIPYHHDNTNGNRAQGQILDCLPVGADQPVTARQLAELCGHDDQRKISRQIEHLRRAGVPICASCDPVNPGYFRAETPAELALYLHGLRGRMKEITATHNALERALNEWVGQATMWGDEANG